MIKFYMGDLDSATKNDFDRATLAEYTIDEFKRAIVRHKDLVRVIDILLSNEMHYDTKVMLAESPNMTYWSLLIEQTDEEMVTYKVFANRNGVTASEEFSGWAVPFTLFLDWELPTDDKWRSIFNLQFWRV